MPVWELRPARESDEEFLVTLHAAVHGAAFAAIPLAPDQLRQLLLGQYLAERGAYRSTFGESGHYIVWSGGLAVGRVWVHRTDAEVRIVDILLLPAHRGQGIGSAVMQRLQVETPPRPLTLHVAVHNTAAIRLYERLGFRPEGVSGMHLSMRWTQAASI